MRALSAGGNYSDYANSGSVPLLYPGVPSPIASLLLSTPSFTADIYNIGVLRQFQTLFGFRSSPRLLT